nr:MAG TPA: hypothetical protein [Caudoviricetes sp.]
MFYLIKNKRIYTVVTQNYSKKERSNYGKN